MVRNTSLSNVCDFFISALAETNRPPFDLPEAEAELVAGYQTEYSGMMYAMFWLGEYANILLMCAMASILFLGGWLPIIDIYPLNIIPAPIWMISKILFLFLLFALIKAIVPRYRYDQLMRLGWKIFLPFSLIYLVLTASFLFFFLTNYLRLIFDELSKIFKNYFSCRVCLWIIYCNQRII